jgi:sigma-B regulation protein RsbU (phosphoserine phosphatase)
MKSILGIRFGQLQLILLAISLAIATTFWLLQNQPVYQSVVSSLISTFIIGNCVIAALLTTAPFYATKKFPLDLALALATVVPVSIVTGYVASILLHVVFPRDDRSPFAFNPFESETAVFFSLVATIPIYLSGRSRARLEIRNRELETQVTLGQTELKALASEMRAASEIQIHLLPLEIPRISGFEIACAWQPARVVSGDYFDVLSLSPGRIGLCLADVSGKGMTAALLMANLQALVRAFAAGITGPGAVCRKVNESLCGNVAPGKFVTMFYGVIESDTRTLRFENAGHCYPVVLRDGSTIVLTEGSLVLGLFPETDYADRTFALQSGDCLLLTTDGVTEAANENDEEFGIERLAAAALAAQPLGAPGIRTRVIEEVTRFSKGNFHDDASLIVMTVD